MEALHLNERERIVVHEGGYILGHKDGLEEGRAEGRAEGKAEGKEEVAKAMISEGLDASLISKLTGLSEEEIQGLSSGR